MTKPFSIVQKLRQEIRARNRRRIIRRRFNNRAETLALNLNRSPTDTEYGFQFVYDQNPITENWEAESRDLVSRLLPNVELFVNVGANVGFYCCMAQSLGVKTIALEPEPANVQFLCKNMTINGFTKDLELFPVAAGNPPPRFAEIFGVHDMASLSAEFSFGSELSQLVPVASLDDIVLGHRWMSNSMLLLIDVEGWEQHVLEGATRLLALKSKPHWIIEILPASKSNSVDPIRIFSTMFENGYRAYRITQSRGPVEVIEESILANMDASVSGNDWNYLFVDSQLSVSDLVPEEPLLRGK